MNSDDDEGGSWIALEAATKNLVLLLHLRKDAAANVLQRADEADQGSNAVGKKSSALREF